MRQDFEKNVVQTNEKIDTNLKETSDKITALTEKFDGHESRILALEEELKILKDRPAPVVSEGIDYSLICMKTDYNSLL